ERAFVANVERKLAGYIGPIAGIVVKRTAATASGPNDLIVQLAANLHVEADRKAFLARKSELLGSLKAPVAASPAVSSPSAETSSGAHSTTKSGAPATSEVLVPLTAERTRRAADMLARYVGPVAKILVERAASRVADERSLYAALAEHVQKPAERVRFLRDAGYPQAD